MIVTAMMMAWQGLVRFGPLRPATQPFAAGKAALIESAAGLMERTRRTLRLGPAYAVVMRELAIENASAGHDPDGLLRQMQQQRLTSQDFFDLQRRSQAVRTSSDLMELARALRAWKQEMTRERK